MIWLSLMQPKRWVLISNSDIHENILYMGKKVTSKIFDYLPELKKSATWEDAWNYFCDNTGFEGDISSEYITKSKLDQPGKRATYFEIWKGDELIDTLTLPGECFVEKDGGFDWDIVFPPVFDYLIKNKLIKKPKNNKHTVAQAATTIEDLRKQRHLLTMKINHWKIAGKDTSELEAQKEILSKRITEML